MKISVCINQIRLFPTKCFIRDHPPAQAMYLSLLTEKTQKELAVELDKSPQAFSKLMISGKANLIELYLDRYEEVITTKLK